MELKYLLMSLNFNIITVFISLLIIRFAYCKFTIGDYFKPDSKAGWGKICFCEFRKVLSLD